MSKIRFGIIVARKNLDLHCHHSNWWTSLVCWFNVSIEPSPVGKGEVNIIYKLFYHNLGVFADQPISASASDSYDYKRFRLRSACKKSDHWMRGEVKLINGKMIISSIHNYTLKKLHSTLNECG